MIRYLAAALVCIIATTTSPSAAQARRYHLIYAFQAGDDGMTPMTGVIVDGSGNLYGTTSEGGDANACSGYGCGTVFKITDGTETVLYAFKGGSDGEQPNGLVRDRDGNLYGTTWYGGGEGCGGYGCGTVFKLAPSGTETVLYSFSGGTDGSNPRAALLLDKADNLYGTTGAGGAHQGGTVFVISPSDHETVLYSFCSQPNCVDGGYPVSGVISDASGNLYGTTPVGGNPGIGTVFRLGKDGTETVLYNFCSQQSCLDGATPLAGLAMDDAGNLYGTTYSGGRYVNYGAVFKLAPDGTETVLHSFNPNQAGGDGLNPYAGVVLDRNGDLFGTVWRTAGAACLNNKVSGVFKLSVDGTARIFCVPSELYAGVTDRGGFLFSTGDWNPNHRAGFVFSVKK